MTASIAFFNNKGGVGKTTLACNFASYMAVDRGLRVAVADCDPQANATQLLLQENAWEQIYEDRDAAEQRTILRSLRDIRAGDSTVTPGLEVHDSTRFGVGVIAGHPSLSVVEDLLSASWGEFLASRLGGARRSLWIRQLLDQLAEKFDLVIFDLGPSLGALNRSVLMGCDFFVTPVAADLFSLYALENIGDWASAWLGEYSEAFKRLKTHHNIDGYDIPSDLPMRHGWAGYSVQQYVAKSSGGKIRGVQSYERYRLQIPVRAERLQSLGVPDLPFLELGIVPNMFSMVPLAQAAHAPISDLSTSDGVRGAQVTQQSRYVEQLNEMFRRLAENVGL
ncbi:ParA family protein [Angustibacter sp. Root456]|uniref:ParA family protein n=1 Tax=Angustibacter sp. Root456 TaxID=1736539 RepID=UPI0006F50997|nr:ParA family protein [Angustibacter sp. Root456]KQX69592.1 hypothetical protein ASD06_00565 [Angustibacter sp. Root456]